VSLKHPPRAQDTQGKRASSGSLGAEGEGYGRCCQWRSQKSGSNLELSKSTRGETSQTLSLEA
jgi:hypothetical protein